MEGRKYSAPCELPAENRRLSAPPISPRMPGRTQMLRKGQPSTRRRPGISLKSSLPLPSILLRRHLNAQENLPPIHPEEDQPIGQQNGRAPQQRHEGISKHLEYSRPQGNAKRIDNESFEQMRHQIGRDRIHPDNQEREGPLPVA